MNINELIQKIESGTYLIEDEIDTLFYSLELITTNYDRKHAKTILKFNDRYICIEWILGTEWEPPTYTSQPYFVEPKTYTKTVIITDWIKCPTRGVIKTRDKTRGEIRLMNFFNENIKNLTVKNLRQDENDWLIDLEITTQPYYQDRNTKRWQFQTKDDLYAEYYKELYAVLEQTLKL